MLSKLHRAQPRFLRTQRREIHGFLIACCWKHQHLIPQDGLRNGLRGAERWIDGKINDAELSRLNYYAEAEAFAIDYAKTDDEISALKRLIEGVDGLCELPFSDAREQLLEAAYFAEGAMIYPLLESLPWVERLFTSRFLCPDLLRSHVKPKFEHDPRRPFAGWRRG